MRKICRTNKQEKKQVNFHQIQRKRKGLDTPKKNISRVISSTYKISENC